MALDPKLIARFDEANEGLGKAIELNDEALCSYYLGVAAGILSTVLPEDEARKLLTVRVLGGNAINREVQRTLARAKASLKAELNG